MLGVPQTGLSPSPKNLYLSQKSSPWKTVFSMLTSVFILFFFVQIFVAALFGFVDGDMDGDLGPMDPLLVIFGTICSTPFLLFFLFLRKPKLAHIVRLEANPHGSNAHYITPGTLIQSPTATVLQHHLVHNTAPLEMPSVKQLWVIFSIGVVVSSVFMLPLLVTGINPLTILLFLIIALPAWILGFSTPVFAWWSTSNEYFGLSTTRRQGEWMLIAGMLSTLPALLINSLISPILINFLGLSVNDEYSLGFGMILFLSAPIGEEISKAIAVLFLARFIDSPKRGFQIGFSVGLGFALLENMIYILGSILAGEGAAISFVFTAVLRAIGSIPGHATWTAISGYAIGHYVISKRWHKRSLGIFDKSKTQQDSQWILFDAKSGQPMISSKSERELPILPKWLSAGSNKTIKITSNPFKAVGIAILLHAMWNGSLWTISVILQDTSTVIQLLANLLTIIILIILLWTILRRLVPFAISENDVV
jgi:RsiW-degrading membrane proteinase PrsW (M82 family)